MIDFGWFALALVFLLFISMFVIPLAALMYVIFGGGLAAGMALTRRAYSQASHMTHQGIVQPHVWGGPPTPPSLYPPQQHMLPPPQPHTMPMPMPMRIADCGCAAWPTDGGYQIHPCHTHQQAASRIPW